jgi:ammonia channel protein AmtB
MTRANEGPADRATRMLAGTLLLYAGWGGFVSGTPAFVLLVVGTLALATGIVGWCPAYTVFGVSTRKIVEAHCPNCESGHRA